MSKQYIEVVISNKEIMEHSVDGGMMPHIMSRLEQAGVPVNGWFINKGFTVSKGHLEYTRNAMSQSSVYKWRCDSEH